MVAVIVMGWVGRWFWFYRIGWLCSGNSRFWIIALCRCWHGDNPFPFIVVLIRCILWVLYWKRWIFLWEL